VVTWKPALSYFLGKMSTFGKYEASELCTGDRRLAPGNKSVTTLSTGLTIVSPHRFENVNGGWTADRSGGATGICTSCSRPAVSLISAPSWSRPIKPILLGIAVFWHSTCKVLRWQTEVKLRESGFTDLEAEEFDLARFCSCSCRSHAGVSY
jgi:hypothetical protein